ncbi:MAG TPA: nuclear transport factor 2 family protein [Solirubrobacteraceae bacterium]|jgi:hypothetical protein
MSQKNVEIVKAAFAHLGRGDLEGFVAHLDSDIEWWDRGDALDPEVFRGHDGVRRLVGGVVAHFATWRTEATDFTDAGEHVVVSIHHTGRGRTSGIPVDQREAYACRVRDGKIIEVREYASAGEALKAVGLEE